MSPAMILRTLSLSTLLAMLAAAPAAAGESAGHHLGVQAGWYSGEIEYESPIGLFADLGVPYLFWTLEESALPLHLRAGYGLGIGGSWKLRFGLRMILLSALDGNLEVASTDGPDCALVWFLMPELELRYDFELGICIGLVVPIIFVAGDTCPGKDVLVAFGFPLSQVYIGYRWDL
ncbi:MAG: hypothetical protein JXR96_26470 [Deltaproteobacteria bacterium]|nr:hypothetical protein [Deltaproteobacteria bacterium]